MLLQRSILSKVCILLVICLVKAQYEYDKEEKKEVKEEEEDDQDYAKIFAEETSAALTAAATEDDESPKSSDFIVPVEFETYYTPAHIFGESNDEPVKASPQKKKEHLQTFESKREDFPSYLDDGPLKDFFDESEKRQQKLQREQSNKDEEVIPPGPSYISHQVPAHYKSYEEDDDDDKSTSASEDVESAPARKNKEESNPDPNFEEGRVNKNDEDYKLPVPFTFEPFRPFKNNKPKVDYDTGKSSSTVSQYPSASGYSKPSASSPYEKETRKPYEKETSKPYEKQASASYEKETRKPYEKERSTPYEKQASAPYEKQASSSYEKEVNPYEQKESSPYDKEVENPYEKDASTPYEKYSFKPSEEYAAQNSKFFDSIISPVKPYNPTYKKNNQPKYETQSTENAPSQLQGKGCRKMASDADDMNCFICENPKTNAKYTQCSFSSQKKPVDYYEGNSAKYSMQQKPEGNSYRYKRYAQNEENDPYTYVKNRATKSSNEGIPSDYNSGFQYEAEHYDESKPELSFSEQHSEELKKNPENCKKVEKDGMTCTICKDPKSGGNFEQCSYDAKPKEKKYAYVTEKKFDNDEPVETQVISHSKAAESNEKEKSDVATKKNTEFLEQFKSPNNDKVPKESNKEGSEDHQAKSSEKKENKDEEGYQYPSYFVKSISSPSYDDSIVYKGASSDNVDTKKKSDYFSDFDEYHFKYFPEFLKQESKQESKTVPVPEATKQNVESVLAEFTKKDRSNCKKAEKKGMTCFLCVDKNNIQNEECMYVQESKPETKHVAYHESKAKVPEQPEKNNTEETKQESKLEPAVTETKNKYFFKNVPNPVAPLGLEAAASETVSTFVRYDPDRAKRNANKKSDKEKELKPDESAYESERIDDKTDPTIKTPEEFNVAPGEGAFSDETKAVYSKELGVQLPKYMLDKSEFEKEFDAFSGAF